MKNYKKMLILFVLLILILGIVFYLYKNEIVDYIQESLEKSGTVLEDSTLPEVSNIDESKLLNTESITQTRFRILKNQVPETFLQSKTATNTVFSNKSLFLKPYNVK
jgi:predicted PurR-regulated permease PerM